MPRASCGIQPISSSCSQSRETRPQPSAGRDRGLARRRRKHRATTARRIVARTARSAQARRTGSGLAATDRQPTAPGWTPPVQARAANGPGDVERTLRRRVKAGRQADRGVARSAWLPAGRGACAAAELHRRRASRRTAVRGGRHGKRPQRRRRRTRRAAPARAAMARGAETCAVCRRLRRRSARARRRRRAIRASAQPDAHARDLVVVAAECLIETIKVRQPARRSYGTSCLLL